MLVPPAMTPLEAAAGAPAGVDPPVPLPDLSLQPMAALEEVVADPVRRPPCYVAFSGGQDSSLLLAASVHAADTYGCPRPIPITLRFPSHPGADEAHWQRLVLDHLRVDGQVVLEAEDLDLVGRTATEELRRRGLLFPANSHSLAPLLGEASGGSLLLGLGGDELFGGHRWTRLNDALARRRRVRLRDVARGAVAVLPNRLRGAILARGPAALPAWLRKDAAVELRRALRTEANEPVRFDDFVRWATRARTLVVSRRCLALLSADRGVRVEAPFLDPRFVAALARAGGARGWGDRVSVMRAVAGEVLPAALLDRRRKAYFDAVFFGPASRRFAADWDGTGVDSEVVDPDALRRAWLDPEPDFRSALLLQAAWLEAHVPESLSPR
jgi:asparagine synthase (glutamine-hydrolysing)